jgi:SPASM domain peptide maturase of grasp-with-spasm system
MMRNAMLVWLENCPVVDGYNRACIYDLIREKYEFAPKGFMEMVETLKVVDGLENWIDSCGNRAIALEYIEYAKKHEFAVEVPSELVECFTEIEFVWNDPSIITNCIIDIVDRECFNRVASKIVPVLTNLLCHFVQLRFIRPCSYELIELSLSLFDNSLIDHIQLVLPFGMGKDLDRLKTISYKCARLNSIRIYGTENGDCKLSGAMSRPIIFVGKELSDYGPNYNRMVVNMKMYCESQEYNTYINRKLYINAIGEIRNSPESHGVFGNICDIGDISEVNDIVYSEAFTQLWSIGKSDIDVCRDCEFRHMCVDNISPLSREDGTWFRPIECKYNPYICKWNDEEGYRTLAECGVVSNAEGFAIDHERIAAINAELWGE